MISCWIMWIDQCCLIGLYIIKLGMREVDKTSGKHITIIKKHSISEKTRGENSSPFSSRDAREDQSSFLSRGIKSLGKKYLQQNVFKAKEKEHHGVVISDELVRNSKQYRMLREKMDVMQGTFIAETNQLLQVVVSLDRPNSTSLNRLTKSVETIKPLN